MGHLEDAIRAFQRGCRLAERSGSHELLCWCQLRLLGVSADFDGATLDASLLSSLRSNIERAAVPSVTIAHQVFLAEYYAKRGDLDASRRHSSLAESVLLSFPNVWLRGLLDLHQSCLSYLEGNYLESLVAARHAMETSGQSGHLLTSLIARADMAAAYLAVGQPARARACLSSALRRSNREEQNLRAPTRDTRRSTASQRRPRWMFGVPQERSRLECQSIPVSFGMAPGLERSHRGQATSERGALAGVAVVD